ncbi:hypothetical protein PVAP13_6KG137636 [Panicum virgatum]|uniref:Uncharacterized protein n=1 Tax=Panicum virgatum TaxID=38727 RepID=A0A8T0REN8_PANVG|nr:hypothetical protein PVAP13_6KG137636 [Panicum virgatum]
MTPPMADNKGKQPAEGRSKRMRTAHEELRDLGSSDSSGDYAISKHDLRKEYKNIEKASRDIEKNLALEEAKFSIERQRHILAEANIASLTAELEHLRVVITELAVTMHSGGSTHLQRLKDVSRQVKEIAKKTPHPA